VKGKTTRPVGRPTFTSERGQRYQIHLPPTLAAEIRKVGNGSLSRGIVRLGSMTDFVLARAKIPKEK
jgi:hypothetical protein